MTKERATKVPRQRGTKIEKRAKEPEPDKWRPVVTTDVIPLHVLNKVNVITPRDFSKMPVALREKAGRNKYAFYQRSDEQLYQFGRIRKSYI